MTEYTIVPNKDGPRCIVAILCDDGAYQMLGFLTKADAEEWIVGRGTLTRDVIPGCPGDG